MKKTGTFQANNFKGVFPFRNNLIFKVKEKDKPYFHNKFSISLFLIIVCIQEYHHLVKEHSLIYLLWKQSADYIGAN